MLVDGFVVIRVLYNPSGFCNVFSLSFLNFSIHELVYEKAPMTRNKLLVQAVLGYPTPPIPLTVWTNKRTHPHFPELTYLHVLNLGVFSDFR